MIYSINDIYRKEIYGNNNSKTILHFLSTLNINLRKYVLKLIISDWYKYNYVIGNFDSIKILNNGIDDVLNLVENNPQFLLSIYKNSYCFYKSAIIYKIISIEKIKENSLDKTLCDINKFHVLDKLTYNFSYKLDNINEYYIDYLEKCEKDKKFIYDYITNKIIELHDINISLYAQYVLTFIREYYKWNFYKGYSLNRELINKEYLDMIKNYPIHQLINISITDEKFLNTIISGYLYNENFNKESEKIEAKKFLLNNTSEEFQKKLRITRD